MSAPPRSCAGTRRRSTRSSSTARGIGKPEVRDEVVGLCSTADQILAELAREPRKLDAARDFLTYYLDAAQRIVEGYADLTGRGVGGDDRADPGPRRGVAARVQQAFDRSSRPCSRTSARPRQRDRAAREDRAQRDLYNQTGGQR